MGSMTRVQFPAKAMRCFFIFATKSRPPLGATSLPWVPKDLTPGVKQPGSEADNSLPSSAKVRNAWSHTSTHTLHLHGVVFS